MGSRRKARELALQMLFQWEVGGHAPEYVISTFLGARQLDHQVEGFARALFEGTVSEAAELDRALAARSQNWRLERMAAVDRNVLRLALFELRRHPETPPAVVINEALEIARRFSGAEAVEFVNGVLEGVRQTLPASETPPKPPAAPRKTAARKRSASRSKDGRGK
jgi:transcription antitermination protein NusB